MLIKLPLCNWPKCPCYPRYVYYDAKIDEWLRFPTGETKEVIHENMTTIYVMLACMSQNCRVRNIRNQATVELLHPIWNDLRKEIPL